MTPDASGKFKGISVPSIPWHEKGHGMSEASQSVEWADAEAALDRINDDPAWAQRAYGNGRGDDRVPCALCNGDGEVCNPLNADPATRIEDWHRPVVCPRCGATGKDPNP